MCPCDSNSVWGMACPAPLTPGTSGFVSSRDVPAVLMCMDVYVAPYLSPSCETQGIAVLEAMAMQRTVVHLGVGGLQVRDLVCGWGLGAWMVNVQGARACASCS